MSIRSLYRLCPPWTRFRRRRKLWKKVVYSWERVWLLVYRFVFFLRDATWNGSLPLWTETRLNLRGMLLFDNETPSWFSTQPSLFLLSFFLFFFYDTHFSLQDSRKKHAPLNAFNILSSFPKNLGKNLAKFSKEFRQGFLCILEIWIRFIDRLGRIASIWEGRRCAQLSTNHRICCCGFRNTRPSSCSSSSSSW